MPADEIMWARVPNLLQYDSFVFDEMPKFGLGQFHQQLVSERRSPGGRFKTHLDALVGFQEIGGG